jgi:hypothetical protein
MASTYIWRRGSVVIQFAWVRIFNENTVCKEYISMLMCTTTVLFIERSKGISPKAFFILWHHSAEQQNEQRPEAHS